MYNLKLEKEEADLLIKGLSELPAKVSYNILSKIIMQINEQVKENEKSNISTEPKK